jgi:hypothetical protein
LTDHMNLKMFRVCSDTGEQGHSTHTVHICTHVCTDSSQCPVWQTNTQTVIIKVVICL